MNRIVKLNRGKLMILKKILVMEALLHLNLVKVNQAH